MGTSIGLPVDQFVNPPSPELLMPLLPQRLAQTSLFVIGLLAASACATTSSSPASGPAPSATMPSPSPDPRVGLRAGWYDAGEALWNLHLVSSTPPSAKFIDPTTPGSPALWNSDLAFVRNYAIQGNFSGYQVWDIANPAKPTLASSYICPGSQSDVSVFRNLMFVSHESTAGRVDCGIQGFSPTDTVTKDRARGIRIFDITNIASPRMLTIVQTCRGSHTHTVVDDPKDKDNVYIYVSGSAGVRSAAELEGCSALPPAADSNSALFRIEVIKVPLAHPEQAAIVSSPRIFGDLTEPARHAETPADIAARAAAAAGRGGAGRGGAGGGGGAGAAAAGPRPGPSQCHDITVYPAIGRAGGACGGYGLLLDISDVSHPKRIGAAADSNFSFWHSATFNNDGTKVLFTDEWGGGTAPRCRVTDKPEWGANAIFTLSGNQMTFQSYYKIPAAQTATENCVAHNGSLIPIPGRDVMVQGWYQGGISIFDWTDAAHPVEIAYHDRGPLDAAKLLTGGHWSSYWYNGYIISSEIARGLDIFELTPSMMLTQNEIDAAKLVHMDYLNVQDQPKLVWPAHFAVARAYLDQLMRSNGLPSTRISAVRAELARAEHLSGLPRRDALAALSGQLSTDMVASTDRAKVRMLANVVGELAQR